MRPTPTEWQERGLFIRIASQLIASEIGDAVAAAMAGDPEAGMDATRRASACAEYLAARFLGEHAA